MLQLERPHSKQSPLPMTTQLRAMILNSVDLLQVASMLGVTARTIRKIMTGQTVSPYIRIKIQTALEGGGAFIKPSKNSRVQHLLEINRMYQEGGTLRSVGAKVGLSGERVRQLLVLGTEAGLFTYKPRKAPVISREKILSDYTKYLDLAQVAKNNKISLSHLKQLRLLHKIEQKKLHAIRAAVQRHKCIEMYISMNKKLGHYPRRPELNKLEKGPYLYKKILRLWGSFAAFRQTSTFTSNPMTIVIGEIGIGE